MTPYILQLQLEEGSNPLSLPLPSSLKQICRLNLSLLLSLIHHHHQNRPQTVTITINDNKK
jgi:hypothetical protein